MARQQGLHEDDSYGGGSSELREFYSSLTMSSSRLNFERDINSDLAIEAYIRDTYGILDPFPIDLNAIPDGMTSDKPNIECLIDLAIWGSPFKRLTASQIRKAIDCRFPTWRAEGKKPWRNSIRHRLTLKKGMYRMFPRPHDEPGTGGYWELISTGRLTRRGTRTLWTRRIFEFQFSQSLIGRSIDNGLLSVPSTSQLAEPPYLLTTSPPPPPAGPRNSELGDTVYPLSTAWQGDSLDWGQESLPNSLGKHVDYSEALGVDLDHQFSQYFNVEDDPGDSRPGKRHRSGSPLQQEHRKKRRYSSDHYDDYVQH